MNETTSELRKDVGKIIYSATRKVQGKVTNISSRYCSACGREHHCYIVKWDDGSRSRPCTAAVSVNPDGTLQYS